MKFKIWLNLITFAALGLVIFFAWGDIVHAFQKMETLNIWVLLLIIPAQMFAFFSLAKVYFYFFKATGVNLSIKQLFAPMMELNFVNHVFPSGGASGFSYLTLRLKPYDVSTAKSTLAQFARFVFTFVAYIFMMIVSLFLLSLQGNVNVLLIFAVTAIAFSSLFTTGIVIFVVGKESRIHGFVDFLELWVNKLVRAIRRKKHKQIALKNLRTMFMELHQDYTLVRNNLRGMLPVLGWAFLTNLAEAALLYIAFMAHGAWVNPGAVIIALIVANTLGLVAILPGGIGIYEPIMTAVLLAGGIPGALALSATLVYRVITLLVSLVTGYFLYHRALSRYGSDGLTGK